MVNMGGSPSMTFMSARLPVIVVVTFVSHRAGNTLGSSRDNALRKDTATVVMGDLGYIRHGGGWRGMLMMLMWRMGMVA
jgi:hypothetical protein